MIYTKSKNTYFATLNNDWKDRIKVEVGDSKQPDFYPQLKILRWDNEVNLSVRLLDFANYSISAETEKIKLVASTKEVHLYNIPKVGYEFEVILKEKPVSNVLKFSIETKGLDFFYQLPLNEEQQEENVHHCTATQCFDKDGNVVVERPENVVGSYAVYASQEKVNYVGGKEYKSGKVLHIYRPKIVDSAGVEVWGDLNVDTIKGILSVTIPQGFLDKAVYPIKHAAGLTFGVDPSTNGGTSAACPSTIYHHDAFTGAAGSGVSMSYYAKYRTADTNLQMAVYDTSDPANKIKETASVLVNSTTAQYWTASFVSTPTFSAMSYWLCFQFETGSGSTYYFDGSTGGYTYSKANTFGSWPDTITSWGSTGVNRRLSIYVTYTTGKNMQINIGDTWKSVTNLQINIGDVWKEVTKIQINIGDVWKAVFG
jgi:hypothetical protein